MYTYLSVDELIQEGRELMWTATAFSEREVPPETCRLYEAWVARARQALADRAAPVSGWTPCPRTGRELVRRLDEVLEILYRLTSAAS